jgi:hypothetical protein
MHNVKKICSAERHTYDIHGIKKKEKPTRENLWAHG